MSGFEQFPNNEENAVENNEIESSLEKETEELEQNIESLKSEIAALSDEEKEDLLGHKYDDIRKMKGRALTTAAMAIPTVALGFADSEILPLLNWHVSADQDMGSILIGSTVIGLTVAIMKFREFLKYKKRVDQTKELQATF